MAAMSGTSDTDTLMEVAKTREVMPLSSPRRLFALAGHSSSHSECRKG